MSVFCILYGGPPDHFLRLLYGGPLRSFFSHTIWRPGSDQHLCLIYGAPQISFFDCYRGGGGTSDQFLHKIYGSPPNQFLCYYMGLWGPHMQVSYSLTIWGLSGQFLCILFVGRPSQISFFSYYMGPLRSIFLHTIWSPLRSVSSHTIWGAPDQFPCLLYMGPC